jgi:hypothetical protein
VPTEQPTVLVSTGFYRLPQLVCPRGKFQCVSGDRERHRAHVVDRIGDDVEPTGRVHAPFDDPADRHRVQALRGYPQNAFGIGGP